LRKKRNTVSDTLRYQRRGNRLS